MFATLNSDRQLRPAFAGAAVALTVLMGMILEPYLFQAELNYKPSLQNVIELVPPVQYTKWGHPAARTATQKKSAIVPQPALSKPSTPVLIAQPGTQSWTYHVVRGQHLDLQIFAKDSLPVLRAHGVALALDIHRPRGVASIFNLNTYVYAEGPVPENIVPRELDEMPAVPGLVEALRSKEREMGCKVTIYGLYSEELYAALRSLTYQVLEQQGISPDTVRRADVELRSTGGRSFTVRLTAHS